MLLLIGVYRDRSESVNWIGVQVYSCKGKAHTHTHTHTHTPVNSSSLTVPKSAKVHRIDFVI